MPDQNLLQDLQRTINERRTYKEKNIEYGRTMIVMRDHIQGVSLNR